MYLSSYLHISNPLDCIWYKPHRQKELKLNFLTAPWNMCVHLLLCKDPEFTVVKENTLKCSILCDITVTSQLPPKTTVIYLKRR